MAQMAIITTVALFCAINIDFFVTLAVAGGIVWLGSSLLACSKKES